MNDEEKQEYYKLAETLISEQNFAAAVIAGAVATFLAGAGGLVGFRPVLYPFCLLVRCCLFRGISRQKAIVSFA